MNLEKTSQVEGTVWAKQPKGGHGRMRPCQRSFGA